MLPDFRKTLYTTWTRDKLRLQQFNIQQNNMKYASYCKSNTEESTIKSRKLVLNDKNPSDGQERTEKYRIMS